MAKKRKARSRKRVTTDLAPRRQAKGGFKGEVIGLEPLKSPAGAHTNGVQVLMAGGSVRVV
jgi:prepilin-type processing-associated H-X9-DG protein